MIKNNKIILYNINKLNSFIKIINNNYLQIIYKQYNIILFINNNNIKKFKNDLNLNLILILNYNNILYIKFNSFVFFLNILKIFKKKTNNIIFLKYNILKISNNIYNVFILNKIINLNLLFIKYFFIFRKIKYINNLKLLIYFIKNSFYLYQNKLKIVGRGWKIVKKNYTILYKIGYSHSFINELKPSIKMLLKKKKKKYYKFFSVFKQKLNYNTLIFEKSRKINIYTGKGAGYLFKLQ